MPQRHPLAGGGLGRQDRGSHGGRGCADGRGDGPDHLGVVLLHDTQRREPLSRYREMRQDLLASPPDDRENVHPEGMGARRLGLRHGLYASSQKLVDALGQVSVLTQRLDLRAQRALLLDDRSVVLLQCEPALVQLVEDLLQTRAGSHWSRTTLRSSRRRARWARRSRRCVSTLTWPSASTSF